MIYPEWRESASTAHKFFHGAVGCDVDALAADHFQEGKPQYLHIEGEAEVLHIIHIHLKLFFPANSVSAVYLCPAGDAGLPRWRACGSRAFAR